MRWIKNNAISEERSGYEGHPLRDDIERLGRYLCDALRHNAPGDGYAEWDDLTRAGKDFYMSAITEVLAFAPALVLHILADNVREGLNRPAAGA